MTVEEYFKFKPETYRKLCSDETFLQISKSYADARNRNTALRTDADDFLHSARKYGRTLDYCRDNCFTMYVLKYYEETSAKPQTKAALQRITALDEFYWRLELAYQSVYEQVMRAKARSIEYALSLKLTKNDFDKAIGSYGTIMDRFLYGYMEENGQFISGEKFIKTMNEHWYFNYNEITDYVTSYPATFHRLIDWTNNELHMLWTIRNENSGGTGGETGGGTGGGTEQRDPFLIFIDKINTYGFQEKLEKLNFRDSHHVEFVPDREGTVAYMAYKAFFPTSGVIFLGENVLSGNWQPGDLQAMLYHQYVHAKQHLVEGINLPLDADGNMVTQEYQLYYDLVEVDLAKEILNETLASNGIPQNAAERNEEQQQKYEYYYNIHVAQIQYNYDNHIPYTARYNKEYVRMELEAYSLQVGEFLGLMTPKLEYNVVRELLKYRYIYEQIKDL